MKCMSVRVWIGHPYEDGKFNGTAFFIDEFTLVTAQHVVVNNEGIIYNNIYLSDTPSGGIVSIDKVKVCKRDIAILTIKNRFNIERIQFTNTITIGDTVEICGFHDKDGSRNIKVHNISGYLNRTNTFELQNHLSGGLSGSPVLLNGKVCGITQAINSNKNITYVIPIIECCSKIIENSFDRLSEVELSLPMVRAPLRFPAGEEPSDSNFYIERVEDRECYEELENGERLIRIKAPKQFGKSSLITRLANKVEKNYHIAELHFEWLDLFLFKDTRSLLYYICNHISDELNIAIEDRINVEILDKLTPNSGATKFMEKILTLADKDILLIIDDADKLFEYRDTSNDLFALIRAWNQKGQGRKLIWKKLKIILTHSTDATLATKYASNSPFNNVGFGVTLKPFDKYEIKDLSIRHRHKLTNEELDEFIDYIGGHPYLARLTLYFMQKMKQSLHDILKSNVYTDHLQVYIWKLHKNEEYTLILKSILNNDRCKRIDNEKCFVLESFGLIKNISTNVEFTCKLYEDFFRKNL